MNNLCFRVIRGGKCAKCRELPGHYSTAIKAGTVPYPDGSLWPMRRSLWRKQNLKTGTSPRSWLGPALAVTGRISGASCHQGKESRPGQEMSQVQVERWKSTRLITAFLTSENSDESIYLAFSIRICRYKILKSVVCVRRGKKDSIWQYQCYCKISVGMNRRNVEKDLLQIWDQSGILLVHSI